MIYAKWNDFQIKVLFIGSTNETEDTLQNRVGEKLISQNRFIYAFKRSLMPLNTRHRHLISPTNKLFIKRFIILLLGKKKWS